MTTPLDLTPIVGVDDLRGFRCPSDVSLQDRIMMYSIPEPNSGCWLWIRGGGSRGYGSMAVRGRAQRAHRASYEAFVGAIGPGLHVCHRCDNPPCVNPDHLFLGTAKDNVRDMFSKGRGNRPRGDCHRSKTHPHTVPRGERCKAAKLKQSDVEEIRRLLGQGERRTSLAVKFGVSKATIWRVANHITWSHSSAQEAV